jgi:glycosyltransferase involved in cell wall biosynthesis
MSTDVLTAPPAKSSPRGETARVLETEARATVKPLHVAFPLGGADLGRSGIGTYVREVLPPLIAQLQRTGGQLTVCGTPAELAAFGSSLGGARQKSLSLVPRQPGLNALWHLTRCDAAARKVGADVLLLPAANRRIVARGSLPTVAVVHDLAQLRVDRKYDPLRMFYFRRVLMPAFRRPARLVAVSGATRDDLVQSLGIAPDRISVVYNGVNAQAFRTIDRASDAVWEARRAAGVHQRPYLLYPARLEHPGKNHVRLLKAFRQSGLASTHTLALSGADWGAGELIRQTVSELKLSDAVQFLGFVPADRLPLLVAGAEAVLMLGLHEGFGLPPLEALSAGRPVCVANTGALPEVVGPLGVQCNPFDEADIAAALARVVRDAVIRNRCHDEGPRWAERFTWTRTAQGLFDACQEVCD